jgi:predicted enzyme involved in methoxymalonyl-ACP biosynthesis
MICVIILQKEDKNTLFINTWLMSCRVLKRGMEHFVLNAISNFAANQGFKALKGEYIPTAKNDMVKHHYKSLGFEPSDDLWILDVPEYENKKCFINMKN